LSLAKVVPIGRMLSAKKKGPELLETVLPNNPEAYLAFAETLGKGEANVVLKIAALELAKNAIDKADLADDEREFHLGRWHAGGNDMAKAIAPFRTSVKMKPFNVRYRVALARALELKGDKTNALVEANQALGASPNDPAIQALVKRLTPPPDPNNPPRPMGAGS
jgi:Flp pilus assembly protein TadD